MFMKNKQLLQLFRITDKINVNFQFISADLIMLGLATHELHFTIIREEFKPGQKKPCEICAQVGEY